LFLFSFYRAVRARQAVVPPFLLETEKFDPFTSMVNASPFLFVKVFPSSCLAGAGDRFLFSKKEEEEKSGTS